MSQNKVIKKQYKARLLDPSLDTQLRYFHKDAREAFNQLPIEKKEKSLAAKSFIIFPFEVHFNQNKTFEEKEQDSLDLIKNHLKTFDNVFVSTSHGMDSVVLCHLVLRAWNELKCEGIIKPKPEFWLNNTLNIYKEERKYWELINDLFEIKDVFKEFKPPKDETGKQYTVWSIADEVGHLPSFRAGGGRGEAYRRSHGDKETKKIGSRGDTPECCDILKKASIKNQLEQMFKTYLQDPTSKKFDCHFIGTRAEESRIRKLGVMQRCRSYTIKSKWPYPIRACTPLSYWLFNDIAEYYRRYNIPKNPTYTIHNMKRMGCASCPAHKNWEIRLANDPTEEGFGMLERNLSILEKTEPERLQESLKTLKKYINSEKSQKNLTEKMRVQLFKTIKQFDKSLRTFEDYTTVYNSEVK